MQFLIIVTINFKVDSRKKETGCKEEIKHTVNPHSNEDNFEIVLPKDSSHKKEMEDLVSPDVEGANSKITQKSQCEDSNIEKVFVNCDASQWPELEQMNKYLDYCIKVGSIKIQNSYSKTLNSKSQRTSQRTYKKMEILRENVKHPCLRKSLKMEIW